MNYWDINFFAALSAVLAIWMCGITNLKRLLWGLGFQTFAIGLVAAMQGVTLGAPGYLWLAAVIILVKAVAFPFFLSWISRKLDIVYDRGRVNPTLGLFAGCGAFVCGFFFMSPLSLVPEYSGAAGMALSLILIGMLVMLVRRLALTQIIGFLVLENGISLYILTQIHGMPIMVEMGVVFDILVGVLVAGMVLLHLNKSFHHVDVTRLRRLKY